LKQNNAMNQIIFDFDRIGTTTDFYTIAKRELQLPEYFGDNPDALYDSLTGDIALPVAVKFMNLTLNQLDLFGDIITTFEDAAAELNPEFTFEYYLRKPV